MPFDSVFGGPKSVISSNVKVILNNRISGYVNNATWNIDYGVRSINEIDRIVPREFAPGAYTVKFVLSGIRIIKEYFEDLRLIANLGLNYVLPYISLAILDRITNEPILNIRSAMIESIQNVVSNKSLVTFNMSGLGFTALNGSNLVDPNYSGSPPIMIQR